MPTILFKNGWRLFFYANEGNEPIHIHCKKGDFECKFWLDIENIEIKLSFEYELGPQELKQIKKLVLENFSLIEEEWSNFKNSQK